jgi:hypothetical protein
MMIFKKAIPRRTMLRGVGASIALPLLDGMIPAFAAPADVAAKTPARFSVVYIPNGVILENWTPAEEGAAYKLTPILEPLAAFRDRFVVLSGLSNNGPSRLVGKDPGGHPTASGTYLTGVYPKNNTGSELHVATSMDQIVAKEFGKHTQLASLELALDSNDFAGGCGLVSCIYSTTIAWRTPTTPLPMENNPRAVFERIFGDSSSTDPAVRLSQIRKERSILDSVTERLSGLLTGMSPSDRVKTTEWLDAVRDIERRIQLAEEQGSKELPRVDRPAGVPVSFDAHAKLMFDLQVLAYQADMTRVITFMIGREETPRTYAEIGIADPHHPMTHHSGNTEKIAKVQRINTYHAQLFAYYLEKLRSTPDGDGSLLDHMMVLYGSGLGDGNVHAHDNLPTLLVDGGVGHTKGGRHLLYPVEKQIPLSNLHLTILDKLGIPVESFGDSNGELQLLSV